MPSWNTGNFIAESIQSVINQTYKNWELIIVDDCSTDNTDEIVSFYKDQRIKYLKNEKNSGAAITRNKALREAQGEWIAFLDSDDLWAPEKLEHQINFMKNNGYNLSFTEYEKIDEESKPLNVYVSGPETVNKRKMYNYDYIGQLTMMYSTKAFGLIQIKDIKKTEKTMITLKSAREIEAMDRAGDFLASIHIGLRDLLKPGVDMWEVEEYVRRRCKEENVLPLQIGVEGSIMDYPYATCCGLNDEVAHAFPRHYILKDGDLLKVDMVLSEPIDKSVLDVSKLDFDNVAQVKKYTESYSGGLADSCWAYAIGTPSDEVKKLMEVTREAMYLGIEQAVVGNRIGDIGAAIQEYAESRGYGVVRDLVGHGVGPTMHEEPMVPNYGVAGRGLRLKEGMVLTIEPMINTGTWEIDTDLETGWAHKTLDGGLSCQYEHQFVITKDGPVILTSQGEERTY